MTERVVRRRRDKRYRFIVLGVFVAVFLFSFLSRSAEKNKNDVEAASLANFDPGYIISDYQMGNYNSMSEAEIQAFLTAKNSCSNTSESYYQQLTASNPGVIWHFEDGHFICLSEERFGDGEEIGSGEKAARIIWKAAQDYHINPQVLLVLLQKETGLITDPIPNNYDYRKATGYGCPDTAACSSEYYGFKNQVRHAAALFSTVLNGGWTNYPLGDNYIQYNPNAACGGSVVNIRSLATSALYRYTPYQPNEGTLAAGYGTAYCGAYGNRNFYLYFQDWFGGITSESKINEYYKSIGGEDSILGEAISEEKCGLIRGGCYKKYENGRIYWTKANGAWDISGRIYDRWFELGTEWSDLGYPISTETRNLKDGGAFQKFENGRIYYKKGIGAWEISGSIYKKWFELGTEWSDLGYPTSGEQKDENGIVYQQFENGRIYYRSGETFVVPDWAEERYEEIGALDSILKNPTNNGRCGLKNEGCYQNYKIGRMYYTPSTGAWDISGKIYKHWFELGTEWSDLGYPTSGEQKDENGIVYQQFENGRIYYRLGETWVVMN
ncbi:hypothetical protein IKF85_01715 [Candidatus Saccharibacteria bacterium]|nr:hypothetical protein [Candidatus Saccharibacteria bacterium]